MTAFCILEDFEAVITVFVLNISDLNIVERYNALGLAIGRIVKVVKGLIRKH